MIIGNDCLTAFLYNRYNKQFDNPFMWTTILDDEFIKLYNEFNTLNFMNFTIYKINESINYNEYKTKFNIVDKFDGVQYCLLIDNKVEIAFLHYIENITYTEKTKIKSEVYYNNCKELIKEHYINRCKRMTMNNVKFIYNCKRKHSIVNQLINKNNTIIFSIDDSLGTNIIKKEKQTERVRLLANRMPDKYYTLFFG